MRYRIHTHILYDSIKSSFRALCFWWCVLAKRICSNSVWCCYLPALDYNNNDKKRLRKKSEKHDNTRTHTHNVNGIFGEQGNEKWLHTQMKIPPHACQTICITRLYWDVTVFFLFFLSFFYLLPIYSVNWVRQNKLDTINENRNKCASLSNNNNKNHCSVDHIYLCNYFGFDVTK